MATLTIRNLPGELHRALRVQAARYGRSTEAEVRAILEEAVLRKGRVALGSRLVAIGRRARLTDEEFAGFAQRDTTADHPIDLE
ncbi:MAG: plasmid stabilization protein [Gammaproteobacteria bacterium]|nr:plasmid stabilization protein [Gammaproteobacteria bacterium]